MYLGNHADILDRHGQERLLDNTDRRTGAKVAMEIREGRKRTSLMRRSSAVLRHDILDEMSQIQEDGLTTMEGLTSFLDLLQVSSRNATFAKNPSGTSTASLVRPVTEGRRV